MLIRIDGTLIISRVKPEDAGKYTCSPSNSLGTSPMASAYLTVQCECYHDNKVEGEGNPDSTERCMRREQQQYGCLCWRLLYYLTVLQSMVTFLNFKVTCGKAVAALHIINTLLCLIYSYKKIIE